MSKMFVGSYTIGGIDARTLDALVDGLIAEAEQADGQPPVSERTRHVNSFELWQIAHQIIERTAKAAPQEDREA